MIHEGKIKVTIKGHIDDAVSETASKILDGFKVKKVTYKIMWPYFWRRRYKVILHKDLLFDDETDTLVEVPVDIL